MIVSKYHVGDLVRILDPVPEGWVGTTDFMREQAGKTTKIIDAERDLNARGGFLYRLAADPNWYWECHMFVPVFNFELTPDEDGDIQSATLETFLGAFKTC